MRENIKKNKLRNKRRDKDSKSSKELRKEEKFKQNRILMIKKNPTKILIICNYNQTFFFILLILKTKN